MASIMEMVWTLSWYDIYHSMVHVTDIDPCHVFGAIMVSMTQAHERIIHNVDFTYVPSVQPTMISELE